MPRILTEDFFNGNFAASSVPGFGSPVGNPAKSGLEANSEYLVARTEAFRKMTAGKNKPMTYGSMRKDKK